MIRDEAAEERCWESGRRTPGIDWTSAYNIAPTEQIPIARLTANGNRELTLATWWLIPHYAKGKPLTGRCGKGKLATLNARAETMKTSGRGVDAGDGWVRG